jgi:SAM-dependent methyltransferase
MPPGGGYAAGVEGDGVDWRALNRANWDSRVPVHLASSFYDVAGFRGGASTLRPFELAEVGSVAGRSLVHLQCHIGLDTLSWARRGALVSGLDFSAPAISAASSLAVSLGLPAEFVVADVYDAVAAFGGQRFDVVYTGIGALVWLPDVPRWARVVAGLLAPGGFVYLAEAHPFAQILESGSSGLWVARTTSTPRLRSRTIRIPTRTGRRCRIRGRWSSSTAWARSSPRWPGPGFGSSSCMNMTSRRLRGSTRCSGRRTGRTGCRQGSRGCR